MAAFALIDTETNWHDQVMSIGTVIADADTFQILDAKYHILTPEYLVGGMFSDTLAPEDPKAVLCSRAQAVGEIEDLLRKYRARGLYAYNAGFDRNHLPELGGWCWYDIMRIAAYRQTNPYIPQWADCCSTGRLRRGYGVEAMLQLLSGNRSYLESHNALGDALDELQIMKLLRRHPEDYIPL